MKKELIFATSNPHKIQEVREILGDKFIIKSSKDVGCREELPETQETLEGNALQKARYLKAHYHVDCFAEDTGLEVVALGGEPGVRTARYAGDHRDAQANMDLLLKKLAGKTDRSAQFRTAIALLQGDRTHLFEGVVTGRIAEEKCGSGGFGYDPVFIPDGYTKTFAELEDTEKNKISHRAKAIAALTAFLGKQHS